MGEPNHQQAAQEKAFLQEVTISLNAALFIVDRLTEEIREQEGRLDNDQEADRLFKHLAEALGRIDSMIKVRRYQLNELTEKESLQKSSPFASSNL